MRVAFINAAMKRKMYKSLELLYIVVKLSFATCCFDIQ